MLTMSRLRSGLPRFAGLLLCMLVFSHVFSVLNASTARASSLLAVCTSAGLVQIQSDSESPASGSKEHRAGLDCPLCSPGAAPPASFSAITWIHLPLFSEPTGHLTHLGSIRDAGPPLPARGPPSA
jgi:hypothetical protein